MRGVIFFLKILFAQLVMTTKLLCFMHLLTKATNEGPAENPCQKTNLSSSRNSMTVLHKAKPLAFPDLINLF